MAVWWAKYQGDNEAEAKGTDEEPLSHGVMVLQWRRVVVVITTTHFHSTKSELSFWAGSNPGCSVSEIRDGQDL